MQEPPKTPPMTGKPSGKAAAAKQNDSSEEESSEEEESDEEEAPKPVSTLLLKLCKADGNPANLIPCTLFWPFESLHIPSMLCESDARAQFILKISESFLHSQRLPRQRQQQARLRQRQLPPL